LDTVGLHRADAGPVDIEELFMTWWMYLIGIAHTAVYVWAFWSKEKQE
jgi:hypothetical protein